VVPYALRDGRLVAALVDVRAGEDAAKHAFPGGRVRVSESLDEAAARWLARGLPGEAAHLEQLYTFGEPGRDPAARVVSVAYLALLPRAAEVPGIAWWPADRLPPLAYDHDVVARVALARLRAKLGYTNIAYSLLPEAFTLAELQHLYEAVLGRTLDRRNFRKRLLGADLLVPLAAARRGALEHNLATMAAALPGARLRPHVKAHKCVALAHRQATLGHRAFTCATIREMEGLARAGLGDDLLLANEVLDARRLGALDARVTVAVDSEATIDAAVRGGVREVLVDVNVGLPRCGCAPEDAGRLADLARSRGLSVRGVMGYEGHVVGLDDRSRRAEKTAESMRLLERAHALVGGEVFSAGGTGTYDLNTWATEIQAGSYALMDTAYGKLGLPFRPALSILATVISASPGYAVADCGLKALGMDHGNPAIDGAQVWFCSDEHVTFGHPERPARVGERIRVWPAHVDPTVAYHEALHVVAGDVVVDRWAVDLRGW
jgi:D-serine deaminase-like pyridoxal phosphate-dependent protein/ADP-ribose pyrophosphatase YjhB (NUDIX family)